MAAPKSVVAAKKRAEPTPAPASKLDAIQQAIERAAQRQLVEPRASSAYEPRIEEDSYAILLMTEAVARRELPALIRKEQITKRRAAIVEIYNAYRALRPRDPNAHKVHREIIEGLTKRGFKKAGSKRSGVTMANLVGCDLPFLRKAGLIEPKHAVPFVLPPYRIE